jgi:glyoxylase-like metal-dependent hydrolase (beta-lactamase superfamily II)
VATLVRVLMAGALVAGMCAQAAPLPEPRIVKVNERVRILVGPIQHANAQNQGYMVNTTVVIGDRGVVVIDPGGSHEVGLHVAKAIRKMTPKPVTHVVNTHFHGDHHFGNSAFPGARIVSSARCREMVLQTGGEWLALMEQLVGNPLPGTRVLPATITYPDDSRTATTIEGVPFVFWVPKPSHTPGDLVVILPADGVLVAGDIAVNGTVPVMQDGNIRNWLETLAAIQALDVATVVPGHGDLMDKAAVARLRGSISRFYIGVQAGYARGLGEREVRATLDIAEWERLERAYVIGRNINRAWLEVEDASVEGTSPKEAR